MARGRGSWLSRKVVGSIPDGVIGTFNIILAAAIWSWGPLSL